MKLSEMNAGKQGDFVAIGGSPEFQRRVTAVGITPGGSFSVVRNERKYPVLLNVRSTILALDRSDCGNIEVEVSGNE